MEIGQAESLSFKRLDLEVGGGLGIGLASR